MTRYFAQADRRTSAFAGRAADDALGGKYDPLADSPDLLDTLGWSAYRAAPAPVRGVRGNLRRVEYARASA